MLAFYFPSFLLEMVSGEDDFSLFFSLRFSFGILNLSFSSLVDLPIALAKLLDAHILLTSASRSRLGVAV
jgi:hypothetical protein